MRSLLAAAGLVLVMSANAWAWNCSQYAYMDIFCDKFDRYCVNPPAYPLNCATGATKDPGPMHQVWHNEAMNYRKDQACGALMNVEDDTTQLVSPPFGGRICNDGITALGELGQANVDLVPGIHNVLGPNLDEVAGGEDLTAQGGTDQRLHLVFNMSGGIAAASALWGSLGYLELALEQAPYDRNVYHDIEVTPTDYILVGGDEGTGCLSCQGYCQNQFQHSGNPMRAQMPTICQSYDARVAGSLCPDPANPTGPQIPCGPPYCPPVAANDIHHTIAVGVLSFLDPNPCHCEMSNYIDPVDPRIAHNHVPTNYHVAFFDGWKWRALSSAIFDDGLGHGIPGVTGSGDFIMGSKSDVVEMWVKTSTVKIRHFSNRRWVYNNPLQPELGGTNVTGSWESIADNIPRKYLGKFNVMRSGTAPGCALNNDTYSCIQWAGTQCIRVGGKLYYGAPDSCDGLAVLMTSESHVSLDDVRMNGGTGDASTGACCEPDTTCAITTHADCDLLGGRWAGGQTTCPNELCNCPIPFADADHDGDVDQDDFGAFQACYGLSTSTVPACGCFDRDNSGYVDDLDFTALDHCFTGANVKWTQALTPSCVP